MIEWIETKVFPDAVRARSFGDDVTTFIRFEPDPRKGGDHYMSCIIFGDVTLETETGKFVKESVVIKCQSFPEIPGLDLRHQFYNELLFYTDILPLFRKYDTNNFLSKNVPKFVYGTVTDGNPKEDVIILKDLSKEGFQMTAEKLFLDEKHIHLAMEKLAEYHALSHRCQREDPQNFNKILSKIRVAYFKNPEVRVEGKLFWDVLSYRGISPLKSDQKYKERLGDLCKHCENSEFWLNKSVDPSQRMNVITHGDFTRNNLLYKYDAEGRPEEVIFLDWGNLKYCSPVVDLSMFLMINTSPEMKRLHWEDFLRTYHSTLSRTLAEDSVVTFEDLELEVRRKAVYGYHWSPIFLSLVFGTKNEEAFKLLDPMSWTRYFLEGGGAKTTEYLSEIVKHMLDRDFIFER